jgi:hypothetical protein
VFYLLEAQSLLDPDSDHDLFVLHCVFFRVINHHLGVFVKAWNHHPMRTEKNWSPHKIWVNGMIDPERQHQTAVKDVVDNCGSDQLDDFGVDYDGPLPEEQLYTVDVPEAAAPSMPHEMLERFKSGGVAINIDEAVMEYMTKRKCLVAYLEQTSSQEF